MGEWWTYSLSDFLMFSPRAYARMVEAYWRELWPWHLGAASASGLASVLSGRRRLALLCMAAVWAWVGWSFYWDRFAQINLAAPWFAAACGLQAMLMAMSAWMRGKPLGRGGWLGWPLPELVAIATLATAWRTWWLCVIPAALLLSSLAMACAMAGVCP